MPREALARSASPEAPRPLTTELSGDQRLESTELRFLGTEAPERETRLECGGEACDEHVEGLLSAPRRPVEVLPAGDEDATRAESLPDVNRRLRADSTGPLREDARGSGRKGRVGEEREEHPIRRRPKSLFRSGRSQSPPLNAGLVALSEPQMAVAREVHEIDACAGELVPEVATDGGCEQQQIRLGLGEVDETVPEIAREMCALQLRE